MLHKQVIISTYNKKYLFVCIIHALNFICFFFFWPLYTYFCTPLYIYKYIYNIYYQPGIPVIEQIILKWQSLDQGWANYGPRDHFMRPAGTCKNFTYCFELNTLHDKIFVKLSCKYLTLLLERVPFSPVCLMQGFLTGGHASPGYQSVKCKTVFNMNMCFFTQRVNFSIL